MTPPPLPPAAKVARSAVWSLVLAGVAWLGLIGLFALGMHDKPAADNRTANLVVLAVGAGMAGTLASLVLAIRVIFLRRRGLVFASLALAFDLPPLLLMVAGILRAALK